MRASDNDENDHHRDEKKPEDGLRKRVRTARLVAAPQRRHHAVVVMALQRLLLAAAALVVLFIAAPDPTVTHLLALSPATRWMLPTLIGYPTPKVPPAPLKNVTYDHRSLLINGERQLLTVATIHYPRSTPDMWPALMRRSKEAGINAIETYVFWNLHEPEEGVYDFESEGQNLHHFLQVAHNEGLYVVLRIGPYVCAEWNLGGFPFWLWNKPGMVLRTTNKDFTYHMETFIRKTVDVVQHLFFHNGGPIILLQVENEYGNVERDYGIDGHRYAVWAADLANSLDVGLPWFMCQQDNVESIINTVNGFYGDNWISSHWGRFPDQPAFLTELWTGWFQQFGQGKYIRPSEDLAFSVARWFARGGSYVGYYMWHGGSVEWQFCLNFGRWGSFEKTPSYDYDAPLSEPGFENQPKFFHLARLHEAVMPYKDVILGQEPHHEYLGGSVEVHSYGDPKGRAIVFLSNTAESSDASVAWRNMRYILPPWSVTILVSAEDGNLKSVYCTSSPGATLPPVSSIAYKRKMPELSDLKLKVEQVSYILEPIPDADTPPHFEGDSPLEQLRTTGDISDYLWYLRPNVSLRSPTPTIHFDSFVGSTALVFINSTRVDYSIHGMRSNSRHFGRGAVAIQNNANVSILSIVTGIENYGPYMERLRKGIDGGVWLDGRDITFGGSWKHIVGLQGERFKYFDRSVNNNAWSPMSVSSSSTWLTLVWYRLRFPKQKLQLLATTAISTSSHHSPVAAFYLNLKGLGRGETWVNGHSIGRQWDKEANCNNNPCPVSGSFYAEKCPTGCREPSQSFYHVPLAWVMDTKGHDDVEVVMFVSGGGNPWNVEFIAVAG